MICHNKINYNNLIYHKQWVIKIINKCKWDNFLNNHNFLVNKEVVEIYFNHFKINLEHHLIYLIKINN
jgi:hypothetical protein